MTYADKGNICRRYPHKSVVPPDQVVTYLDQIASALQYAHANNVVPNDVKPENILLGGVDDLWLSDFGIASSSKAMQLDWYKSPNSIENQVVDGTIAYMALERFTIQKCLPASDQYSLAVVAYEWLTGALPFSGSSEQIINDYLHTPPPPLRQKNPTVHSEVERVILKALQKQPDQRYASVELFA